MVIMKYHFPGYLKQYARGLLRGPFEKFVDWRQSAAVMQRKTVIVMPSCSGGCDVVVALSSSL
jgi:hypothetical protein